MPAAPPRRLPPPFSPRLLFFSPPSLFLPFLRAIGHLRRYRFLIFDTDIFRFDTPISYF